MLTDDGDRLGGRDIGARRPVIEPGGVEVFLDELFMSLESVTATHRMPKDYHLCSGEHKAKGVRPLQWMKAANASSGLWLQS